MSHTAIVILNYNGEKLLRQFLPSVIQHSANAEIIIADNGSTDGSLQLLDTEFPSIRVIRLDKNYGFCGGYNRALREVEATYYVLLNSDVAVTPHWLDPIIAILDKDAQVAALQPKILSFHQRHVFEYAGAGGGYIDRLGYPFCRGRIFDHVEEDKGQYNDTREIFWATGACLIIRAKVYHQFKGLDEDFFAHMEEIDLCWKIQRDRYKIMYCGQSTVYHLGAGTLGYATPRKTYLNFRNGLSLLVKHLDSGELLYKLPARMCLDWAAALFFAVQGQFQHTRAVFGAHLDFIVHIGRDWKKRNTLHQNYPSYNRDRIYPGSILWNYFIRKKRKLID